MGFVANVCKSSRSISNHLSTAIGCALITGGRTSRMISLITALARRSAASICVAEPRIRSLSLPVRLMTSTCGWIPISTLLKRWTSAPVSASRRAARSPLSANFRAGRCHAARAGSASGFAERRTRDGGRDTDRFRVLQVCVDRRDDNAGLDGDQIDADEGDSHPRIDDDAFVENPVEDINE